MKAIIFSILSLFFCYHAGAQELKVNVLDPPLEVTGNFGDWGTDLVVSSTEPFGAPSGVIRPNDTLYVAVPDTNIISGNGMVILKSSNNGANWQATITISPAIIISKTRMVRSGLDTVYCFFQTGSSLYILKVNLPLGTVPLRQLLSGGYRDFDGWCSSTGGLYLFVDSVGNNYIPRYASPDGGVSWSQRGLVTSSGAHPFLYRSGTGDTAILLYYQITSGITDTSTAAITHARYRESSLGALSSIAFLTGLVPAGPPKGQYGAALYGGYGVVMYTTGAPGSRNIEYYLSINGGIAYTGPNVLAGSPNVDEYNFDIQHFTFASGGFDAVYYWDSTGGPNNSTDKLMYTNASLPAPVVFESPLAVSEHPPVSSTRGYVPFLIEYFNTAGDVGAVWVGLDGSNRRVYFDRLGAPVGVQNNEGMTPVKFSLGQNYPNPFNPATKIDFAIPVNGFVSIRMYDIIGREVAVLLSKEMKAGSYTMDIDASRIPSGVYFYRMMSGSFSETRKLVILK